MDAAVLLTLALSLLIAAQQPHVPASIKAQAAEIASIAIAAANTGLTGSSTPMTEQAGAVQMNVEDAAAAPAPLTDAVCLTQVTEIPVHAADGSGPAFERHETMVYVDEDFASYFLDQGGYERC